MSTERREHTATLLPDGRVLIVGDFNYGAPEIYDPALDTWAITSPAVFSVVFDHAAVLLPIGKVLVTGGQWQHQFAELACACTALYDPTSDTWSDADDALRDVRAHHTSTLLANGEVVIAGSGEDGKTAELYSDSIPPQVALSAPTVREDGAIEFRFTAGEGFHARVLVTTNLSLPMSSWDVYPPSGFGLIFCAYKFVDIEATNYEQRFYRVRLP